MRRALAGLFTLFLVAAVSWPLGPASGVNAGNMPLDIMVVLDNSRSMKQNDPKFLSHELVRSFIKSLPEGSACGMVIFGRNARRIAPLTPVNEPGAVDALSAGLRAVDYSDNFTDSPAGIERALYELVQKGRPGSRKIIVFLTDGIVDTGDKQEDARKREWLLTDIAGQCKKNGVRVFGAAFTEEADYQLIQSLAERTSGGYFRALALEEIRGILSEVSKASLAADETESAKIKPAPAASPAVKAIPAPESENAPAESGSGSGPVLLGGLVLAACLGGMLYVIHRRNSPRSVILKKNAVFLGSPDASRREPAQPKAELLPISGTKDFLPIIIREPVTRIGRKKGNEVVIDNPAISRFHAVIEYKDGAYYIEDQNSSNKTVVNDKPITPHTRVRLESGMTVAFDTVKYRFARPDERPDDDSEQEDDSDKTIFHNLNHILAKPAADKPASPPPPLPKETHSEPLMADAGKPEVFEEPENAEKEGAHETSPSFSPAEAIEAEASTQAPPRAGANICPWHPDRFASVICPKCKKPCCDKCMAAKDGQFLCPACRLGD